ncbi:MAG: flagellar hook-associated protein FlgK [Defluviitaleaceae bacterium]|nr:flagellar hook-associated protein FlgK [Defluviitaleaceae bacterium]
MRSSFFEFHVASRGLFTARAGLQVVSHNIANAATPGFSRQFVEQRASQPLATWNSRGMIGTGSEVFGIGQIRSFYLDQKFWTERGVLGQHTAKTQLLTGVETVFNEMSGTGISSNFDIFFARLQDLTTNAPDGTFRNNVLMTADSLARFINTTAQSLRRQQINANTEVSMVVSTINNLGLQIAGLNERISKFEMDGSRANDLRDQRALLIDELSQFVNVEVIEREHNDDFAAGMFPNPQDRGRSDQRLSIRINGYEFVNHWDVNTLQTVPRQQGNERNDVDAPGLYDIRFSNGVWFNIYSPTLQGQLRGIIDVRDGNNLNTVEPPTVFPPAQSPFRNPNQFRGVPFYLQQLNHMVRTFARAMNEGLDHQGQPIPGSPGHVNGFARNADDPSGRWFFTFTDNAGNEIDHLDPNNPNPADPYAFMNAFNFQVSSWLREDPERLATADVPVSAPGGGESNNNVIFGFTKLAEFPSLFREGSIGDFVNALASQLGIDLRQSANFAANYHDVTQSIDNQRMSVSGVSLNEEILSMITFQQQFVAASRLMSVINEVYDNLINRMGL